MKGCPHCKPPNHWLVVVAAFALFVLAVIRLILEWPFPVDEEDAL